MLTSQFTREPTKNIGYLYWVKSHFHEPKTMSNHDQNYIFLLHMPIWCNFHDKLCFKTNIDVEESILNN
jgi:hypothetical protein